MMVNAVLYACTVAAPASTFWVARTILGGKKVKNAREDAKIASKEVLILIHFCCRKNLLVSSNNKSDYSAISMEQC